ncbi:MAG: cbb3-type cytochrome c oxidase subunit 3 [Pseudomonadota bacterium]|nr:cbb3-type cytochrome c oxidase subunit 3 [Pseudomonadota bacterium]
MSVVLFNSIWTLVVMAVFLGIVWWAWSSKRRQSFDEAANIPFHEDEPVPTDDNSKENSHG